MTSGDHLSVRSVGLRRSIATLSLGIGTELSAVCCGRERRSDLSHSRLREPQIDHMPLWGPPMLALEELPKGACYPSLVTCALFRVDPGRVFPGPTPWDRNGQAGCCPCCSRQHYNTRITKHK